MKTLFASLVGTLALLAVAVADDKKTTDSNEGDQAFVTKASAGGMAEVKFGKLAAENGSPAVKKFAKHMVEDHGKANKELAGLAGKKNLKVAKEMDSEHAKKYESLSKLEGAEFDRMYMAGQVKDHEDTVALFEKEAKSAKDSDLGKWAEKTLPTLREHLKMARQVRDEVSGKKGR